MILGFDASTPPQKVPAGYKVAIGYIGGPTPHVWTRSEWQRFNGMKKLPVMVASIAVKRAADPEVEAFTALRMLYRLNVPKGHPVMWDLETAINPSYVALVGQVMHWAGYRVWPYGSVSTIFSNPALDGYAVADYKGIGPFAYPHPNVRMTQYAAGTQYDSNVVQRFQYLFRLKAW